MHASLPPPRTLDALPRTNQTRDLIVDRDIRYNWETDVAYGGIEKICSNREEEKEKKKGTVDEEKKRSGVRLEETWFGLSG